MNFTPEQQAAITLPHNLVVTAGAGSGKTRVLVERYLRLLSEHDVESILAITFTEKAAREMRDRVRRTVEQRARAAPRDERPFWEERRTAIESARIGTIHSFCAALLRAHPAETGLDPRFSVIDEVEAGLLLAESVDAALAQAIEDGQAEIEQSQPQSLVFQEFGLSELRVILASMLRGGGEVRAAVAGLPATADALRTWWHERLTAAQAGARDELLNSQGWRSAATTLLALASNAPAGDRIGEQVLALAAWLAGFDGDAVPDFALVAAINLQGGSKKSWGSDETLREAKDALRKLRDRYSAAVLLEVVPDPELEQRAAAVILDLAALYRLALEHYSARKRQQDILDFDDLERYAGELLQQPAARARWQAELRAVLVDEFQDTNDEQRAIVYALTGLETQPANTHLPSPISNAPSLIPNLFVVGDGKQSIYRFRGADVSVFRAVAEDIVQRAGQAVALDTSFRAHPPLVSWINGVTAAVFARDGALRPYEFPFEPLRPYRPAPPHTHCVELHLTAEGDSAEAGRKAEARALAARIAALVTGAAGSIVYDEQVGWRTPAYGDFALLFQASTVFEYYEQALRQAGIPYLTTAGRGYYGRKEVQDLIHLLRVLDDPSDDLALVGVLRSPLFALDDATILRLRFAGAGSLWNALMQMEIGDGQLAIAEHIAGNTNDQSPIAILEFTRATLRDLHARRGHVTVVELLRAALAQTGYLATISGLEDGDRRRVNVEKLVEAARLAGAGGLSRFRDYLDSLLAIEPREGEAPLEAEGSVRIMTVHRSKGLEFPIVVLPDLGRANRLRPEAWLARRGTGLALQLRGPTGDAEQPLAYRLALAEERRMEQAERERLLYVALTRASDYLILSGPTATRSGDDWLSRIVSAIGYPWESGGPPESVPPPLAVFRYGEECDNSEIRTGFMGTQRTAGTGCAAVP